VAGFGPSFVGSRTGNHDTAVFTLRLSMKGIFGMLEVELDSIEGAVFHRSRRSVNNIISARPKPMAFLDSKQLRLTNGKLTDGDRCVLL
jgi:hypothetical protein